MEYVPDRSIWENQIRMKDIITLLPDFEIIGFFDVNLLLKNVNLIKKNI